MTETMVPPESTAESRALVPVPSSEVVESPAADIDLADTVLLEAPIQDGLIVGRPVEDRAFEAAETALGMAAGATIGTVVAGPVGLVVGGVIGAAGGLIAGEALERHEGRVARTTDADPADADVPHLE